jgi:hypothetical protein
MKNVNVPKILDTVIKVGARSAVSAWILRLVFYPNHIPGS